MKETETTLYSCTQQNIIQSDVITCYGEWGLLLIRMELGNITTHKTLMI